MSSSKTAARSCVFPAVGKGSGSDRNRPLSVRVELQHPQPLQQLLTQDGGKVLLAGAIGTAWALVLRAYTGLDQVCFGFGEVGGTSAESGSSGSEMREPVAAYDVDDSVSLEQLLDRVKADSPIVSPHHESFRYNTAVLLRFANQAATTQNPNKATLTTMAQTVGRNIALSQ